jgi:tetratricopeptide (TPR) repeat protein
MGKGQFVKALNSLKEVNTDDTYISVFCIGLQGDCNVELKKYDAALKLYEEASIAGENNLTTPMYLFKAGAVAEQLKKYSVAGEHYIRIRDEFPEYASQNIFTIDKYIARVSSNKAK